MSSKLEQLASRMDALYEFDREEVTPAQYKPGAQFAGLFAGEHVAGTEFVIGAFFVLHGVRAADLLLGLLLGNLLAVLSWTLICAPIATETAPASAKKQLPGPDILGDAFVLAAQLSLESSGRCLAYEEGKLVAAEPMEG